MPPTSFFVEICDKYNLRPQSFANKILQGDNKAPEKLLGAGIKARISK
jgi:hypothetical protein